MRLNILNSLTLIYTFAMCRGIRKTRDFSLCSNSILVGMVSLKFFRTKAFQISLYARILSLR